MLRNFVLFLLFTFQLTHAQELPLGYVKLFDADFNCKTHKQFIQSGHADFHCSNGVAHLHEETDTLPGFFPKSTIIIDNNVWGDFILKANAKFHPLKSDSLSGFYIITGLRDSANYYFIQVNKHGAFFNKMYKNEPGLISSNSSFTINNGTWNEIVITRDILNRTIELKNGNKIATFTDPNLVMGYVGFGVSSYKLAIDKLTIWAPTSIDKTAPLFNNVDTVNK